MNDTMEPIRYESPELTILETDAQDVICTSAGNENLFENGGLW